MGKDTSYSLEDKSAKMISQFWTPIHSNTKASPFIKWKLLKLKSQTRTPHVKSHRLQYPTLTNGQLIKTKTKKRNNIIKGCYESNGPNRELQNILLRHKRIYFFLITLWSLLQNWHYTVSESKSQQKQDEINLWILSDQYGLKLNFNNNRNNRKPTDSWKLNTALRPQIKEFIKKEIKFFLEFNENEVTIYT